MNRSPISDIHTGKINTQEIIKAERLDDIDILRAFSIIVVVFFHCYGMMYAEGHFPNSMSVYENRYFTINQSALINVAMPMFTYVSGYLFQYLLMKGKYQTWGGLLKKKGLRILLPYLVFGAFFMVTTGNWHPLQLLNGDYWHLWFLPMLFWCFIIGYSICRIKLNKCAELILLLLSFSGTLVPSFSSYVVGVSGAIHWFYWFYIGMLAWKYRDVVTLYVVKYKLYVPFLLFYFIIVWQYPVYYGVSRLHVAYVIAITCLILSVSTLMSKVDWGKYKITTSITKFSAYSFGIYIWHNWVALMLISNTSKRLLGLEALAANHVILFPLCFSLITLAISWFLSWCMMKTKVGRFLIG